MNQFLTRRLHHLQLTLPDHKLVGLLVSSPANLTYLTDIPFSPLHREAFLLATTNTAQLFVSPLRLSEFSHLHHLHPQPLTKDHPLSVSIDRCIDTHQTLGIEADDLRVEEFNNLKSKVKVKIKPTTDIIVTLRIIKDPQEIKHITKACQLTTQTWQWLKPQIHPGITEKHISHLIIDHLYDLGADGTPAGFEPFIASGTYTAVPHHTTSNRHIRAGEPVLVDFGCCVHGYASDFTRTIFVGKPTRSYLHIESTVQAAYKQAVKSLSQLSSPQQVDQATRQFITDAGFGDNFIHNTGHGLGLEIHEPPHFHHQYQEPNLLQPNMVVAIEPGIYLPGKFGYRWENTILLTKQGPRELTSLSENPEDL